MNLVDVNGMDPGAGGAEDAAASVGDSWSAVLRDTYALAFGGVKGLIALHLADYFYDIGAPTSWARSALGVDDVVDRDSEAYKWGQFCAEMATPGGGGTGGGRLLTRRMLGEVKEQFAKNENFKDYFHNQFNEEFKGGGERRSPDLSWSEVAEAHFDWMANGRPARK